MTARAEAVIQIICALAVAGSQSSLFQHRLNHGHEDLAATVFPGAELLRLAFGRRCHRRVFLDRATEQPERHYGAGSDQAGEHAEVCIRTVQPSGAKCAT